MDPEVNNVVVELEVLLVVLVDPLRLARLEKVCELDWLDSSSSSSSSAFGGCELDK